MALEIKKAEPLWRWLSFLFIREE